MSRKKRKIALPTDRNGKAICVGDTVAFADGTVFKVECMEFYGSAIGWSVVGYGCDDERIESDNPSSALIIDKSLFGGDDE